MERKHTPTPWKADPGDTSVWWAITTERSGEVIADLSDSAFCAEDDALNARRIVACVNACDGIDDPAAALAEVRASLSALLETLDDPEDYEGAIMHAYEVAYLVRSLLGGAK